MRNECTEQPSLCNLALGLPPPRKTGGRPGEVGDGDDEEAVATIGKTGQGVVPRGECS